MRARFIALFISCLSLSAAMGQRAGTGTVKGFLRSKHDNQPQPFSAVMLQNPKDSSVAYSAVSNDKCFFQISGIADGEYRFVATYLGYAPLERNINISRGARTMDFGVLDLEEAEITLNQVTVKEDRIPVTVKQDTLEFDASAYKLRDNAVVEDILKRLPGLGVSAISAEVDPHPARRIAEGSHFTTIDEIGARQFTGSGGRGSDFDAADS